MSEAVVVMWTIAAKVCIVYLEQSYFYCCGFAFVFVFERGYCSKTHYVNGLTSNLENIPAKTLKSENYSNKLLPQAGNFILRLKYYMDISEYSYTLHPNTIVFMKIFWVLLFYILLLDQVNTNFLN